jgi:adenylosuccinate lyase
MSNSSISLSPLDDRYRSITSGLTKYFSEYALFKYRLRVELKYLKRLVMLGLPQLSGLSEKDVTVIFKKIYRGYDETAYKKIKEYEATTKHDVKALEYYMRDAFKENCLSQYSSFIHFALTSQDINNTAVALQLKDFLTKDYSKQIQNVISAVEHHATNLNGVRMISRTHGQPAVPTDFGKEFKVFSYRLCLQVDQLRDTKHYGKFGGASGNLNAHRVAYPDTNWVEFGEKFMESLGLIRSAYTTQIDSYDSLATIFDCLRRINVVLIDLCQDMWLYISMDYLRQKINKNEVGSSTMPHKVNPINFENAEGNLKLANSLLDFMSNKLPVSRLQRDLTDSTVLRNVGVIFGHIYVAFDNLTRGLNKLDVNLDKINKDLEDNYVVVTEGIQTILRKYGHMDAYEQLKAFSRNNEKMTRDQVNQFISLLDVDEKIKEELRQIDVTTY